MCTSLHSLTALVPACACACLRVPARAQVISLGKVTSYPRYSKLVREGTLGSTAFVILSGQLLAFSSKGGPGGTLGVASIFGEVGLVEDVVRDCSVSAVSTCRTWSIDRALLDPREKYLRPSIMDTLEKTPEWRELQVQVIEGMLASLPFFGTLVPSRRLGLAGLMTISWHGASAGLDPSTSWVLPPPCLASLRVC